MRTIEEIKADIERVNAYEPTEKYGAKGKELKLAELADECLHTVTNGIPIDELETYCNAIRDGRCAVLPCKVGDNAWWLTGNRLIKCRIHRIQINKCGLYVVLKSKVVHGAYHTDRFGKTVFFTREEAEAALRKEQGDEM